MYGVSQEFSFQTPPTPGFGPVSFFAIADLGELSIVKTSLVPERDIVMKETSADLHEGKKIISDLEISRKKPRGVLTKELVLSAGFCELDQSLVWEASYPNDITHTAPTTLAALKTQVTREIGKPLCKPLEYYL